MHIVTILGSPRRKGNTAAVLGAFEQRIGPEHSLDHINLWAYHVKGCLGCDVCMRSLAEPGCKQRDDTVALLERIRAAELVVYASPVYCWAFTAQLKALMDRHYCLVKWQGSQMVAQLMAGRLGAMLVTCGGDAAGNADLVAPMFVREMDYLGCHVAGMYVVADCTTPDVLGEKLERTAARMAADLLTHPEEVRRQAWVA
jgi:multimeric flavodoxin WrbA